MNDIYGENISIVRCEALHTAGLQGTVIDLVLEVFELHTGMDRPMGLEDGVLMHDDNDGATLRFSIGSDCSDLDLRQLVVINTSDIDGPSSSRDDPNIIACNATIGSSIDKGSDGRLGMMG